MRDGQQPGAGGPDREPPETGAAAPAPDHERRVQRGELGEGVRVPQRLLPGTARAAYQEPGPGPRAPAAAGQFGEKLVGELPAAGWSLDRWTQVHPASTVAACWLGCVTRV